MLGKFYGVCCLTLLLLYSKTYVQSMRVIHIITGHQPTKKSSNFVSYTPSNSSQAQRTPTLHPLHTSSSLF